MRFVYLFLLLNNFVWETIGQIIYPNYENIYPVRISFSESGNIIAISNKSEGEYSWDPGSAIGSVRIFENVNGLWNQVGQTITGSYNGQILGESISLNYSGDRIAISSWGANKTEIYDFNEATNYWEKNGQDLQEGGYNSILNDVGDILFVGSYFDGLSKIYSFKNLEWEIIHEFTTEQNGNATKINMSADGKSFILADDGVAKIFKLDEGVIAQIGQSVYYENDYSVDINSSGNVIVIEAEAPNSYGTGGSQIAIFQNLDNEWVRLGNQLQGSISTGRSKNIALSADGNSVIVNTTTDDSNEASLTSYSLVSDSWVSNNTIYELLLQPYNHQYHNHFGGIIEMSPDGQWIAYPIITSEGLEVRVRGINDKDSDGLPDVFETNTGTYISPNDTGTDPNNEDSDGDTILDNVEITNGTNPNLSDTDSDGLDDSQEATYNTDPNSADTSGDGLKDGEVVNAGFDPTVDYTNLKNVISQGVKDLRPGSTMIEVSGNQATVQLQMEESTDLQTWEDTGTPATMTIPADTDTKFIRFKMAE